MGGKGAQNHKVDEFTAACFFFQFGQASHPSSLALPAGGSEKMKITKVS